VPIVKCRWADPKLISEAMTFGASMVMVPHVRSRQELDEAVRASRFEPVGTRGLCPVARYLGYGAISLDSAREVANSMNSVIPIIEDVEALDHLDELFASPDVDIYEIGPFDLSQSLKVSTPGKSYGNPETMQAIEKILDKAAKYKKAVLAPLWVTPETDSAAKLIKWNLEQLVPKGLTLLYGLEVVMIARWFRELGAIREGSKAR
jgi:4-hydroxy-2-oxoheptanedioate aldolase